MNFSWRWHTLVWGVKIRRSDRIRGQYNNWGENNFFTWSDEEHIFFTENSQNFEHFHPLCVQYIPWSYFPRNPTRHSTWREAGCPLVSGILWCCSLFETCIILQNIYIKWLAVRTNVSLIWCVSKGLEVIWCFF